jgi:hypothetical protein
VPTVQNLAWNVVTVDLSVAAVVVECDVTQALHRGPIRRRGLTARTLEADLGVADPADRAALLSGAAFPPAPPAARPPPPRPPPRPRPPPPGGRAHRPGA